MCVRAWLGVPERLISVAGLRFPLETRPRGQKHNLWGIGE